MKLYRKSAEQGHSSAQLNLGVMNGKGQGVLQDNVYAHMWLNIAASTETGDVITHRNKLAKEMTTEQLAEAQKLARECVKKKFKGC